MPGAVARTSTLALNNATLSYVLRLADNGLAALRDDPHFANGLNIFRGRVTCEAVATAHEVEYVAPGEVLEA
jgi:alanine dehydrogenase